MKNQNFFGNFFIIIIFFLIGFFLISQPSKNLVPGNIKQVKIAGQSIEVELALTDIARMEGLSGRNELGNNAGMLFVFDKPGKYFFWMKDMNFPIDIIWLGEDQNVIYIKKDAQPENFLETYGPEENAKYVLEVVSGFSDRNNLKMGDTIEFEY